LPDEDSLDRQKLLWEINHLAAQQETEFHKFALFGDRVYELLQSATRGAKTKLEPEDRAVLSQFNDLRNFFEHPISQILDEDDPSISVLSSHMTETTGHVVISFPIDEQGKFITKSGTASIDSETLEQVRGIVVKYYQKMEENSLESVERYYRENPDLLVHPLEVNTSLFWLHDICARQ